MHGQFKSPYQGEDDLDALVYPEAKCKEEPWMKEWRIQHEKEEAAERKTEADREKKSREFTISPAQVTGGSEDDDNG